MKKLYLVFFLVFLSSHSLFSQNIEDGWDGIPWGISKAELIKRVRNSASNLDSLPKIQDDRISVGKYKFLGETCLGGFALDSVSLKFASVGMVMQGDMIHDNMKIRERASEIENRAIQLYGKPDKKEDMAIDRSDGVFDILTWFRGKTYLKLSILCHVGQKFSFLFEANELDGSYDFRHAKWGDSVTKVKQSEDGTPFIDEDGIVAYSRSVAGFECDAGYIFVDNKLVRTKYMFNQKHTNKNDYINDYYKIKSILTKKYGEPEETDDANWDNDLYQDDPQSYGFAVSLGHVYYMNHWSTPSTSIQLVLGGENYKIHFEVQYTSEKYSQLEKKKKQEATLDDF